MQLIFCKGQYSLTLCNNHFVVLLTWQRRFDEPFVKFWSPPKTMGNSLVQNWIFVSQCSYAQNTIAGSKEDFPSVIYMFNFSPQGLRLHIEPGVFICTRLNQYKYNNYISMSSSLSEYHFFIFSIADHVNLWITRFGPKGSVPKT